VNRFRKIAVAALVAACSAAALPAATARTPDEGAAQAQAKPNIIFILTDDLSRNLTPYMTALNDLKSRGTTFENYVVADSLCCPSRASILTGEFPHNTGVRTNTDANDDGGYPTFRDRGHNQRTYAAALDDAGYRTGHLGKFMNEYTFGPDYRPPAGWDEWHVASGGGYGEFSYDITRFVKDAQGGPVREIDKLRKDPAHPDKTYLTDVLKDRAVNFIDRSDGQPFFLQVSTYAPHSRVGDNPGEPRFPAAYRDRPRRQGGPTEHGDCGPAACNEIRHPRGGAFNENTDDKPAWVRRKALDPKSEIPAIDTKFRDRVRMVQSVNDLIKGVLASLTPAQAQNTYVVFSSDNGFHLGQHRLLSGKSTAYDHDIKVPLIVAGPGVRHRVAPQLAQNVDLYPTFLRMAGIASQQRDGHSLLGILQGENPAQWRKGALIEHRRPGTAAGDPDAEPAGENSTPPSYRAIRTADKLFVRYGPNSTEYYDLTTDAPQNDNKPNAAPGWISAEVDRLAACGTPGHTPCWQEALDPGN
jgi:N-acetylglucosamine-6-sulfatase